MRKLFNGLFLFTPLLILLIISTYAFANHWKPAQALPQHCGTNCIQAKLLESSTTKIALEYTLPEISFVKLSSNRINGTAAERMVIGNVLQFSKPGEPLLPFVPVKLILPQGYTIDHIETEALSYKEAPGRHIIEYGQLPRSMNLSIPYKEAVPNPDIYNSDAPYPQKNYKLVTIQKKCGISIAFINLFPVTLHPKSGKVIVADHINLAVFLKKDPSGNVRELAVRPQQVVPLHIGIENPQAIATYTSLTPTVPCKSSLCRTRDDAEYLIIARNSVINASISPSLNDLLDYRKSEGFTGKIASYEDAIGSVSGNDEDEVKLREFIKSAYNNWNTRYVFLAGAHGGSDETSIISKTLYITIVPAATIGGYRTTDFFSQCLDGDYNYNKSDEEHLKKFGEWDDGENGGIPDMMAEVSIGRVYALTPEDVSNAIYKMLAYEQSSDPYTKEILLAGEAIFDSEKHDKEMWYAKNSMVLLWDGCSESQGLKNIAGLKRADLFDADVCNYAPPPKPPELFEMGWEADEMLEKINANKYSIINHLGHGDWQHGLDIDVPAHTDLIENTKYFFVYTQACLNGGTYQSQANISQRLTAANRFGAWGGVFNTTYGYAPYKGEGLTGPNERMHMQFWDAYIEGMRRVGDLNMDSHEDNIPFIEEHHIRYCMAITMLFADPAARIKFSDATPVIENFDNSIKENTISEPASITFSSPDKVRLTVRDDGVYSLYIYALNGKVMLSFDKRKFTTGTYSLRLKKNELPAGVYILRLEGTAALSVKGVIR